ncbi:FAD-binding oxidoreductase, partial [Microvirga sp. 3-52]|nr:FAD-binding oxidoreductase [Microvirga sp. 3-52]
FGQKLARLAVEAGARIFENTAVIHMDFDNKYLSTKHEHTVHFSELVLCTHYPIEALRGIQVMKLAVDRSYIVSAEADMALQGQYISVDSPKRSVRTAKVDGKTYILLSGASHPAGMKENTEAHYTRLYDDMADTFKLSRSKIGWSAQDPETPDIIPYAGIISSSMPHIYISTGYSKWGLSNSLACARIISDQIVGKKNRATPLFAPSRTGFGAFARQALKLSGLVAREFTIGHMSRREAPICTHMGC